MRAALIWVLSATLIYADPLPPADAEFEAFPPEQVKLGQLLFYDPILSGNKTVACATCHHPKFATSDGLSLGLGDGATGLGPDRKVDPENMPEQRIPRNSPALFNLGAREFTRFFHDGRLEADPTRGNGLRTPLEEEMVPGFASALSAQSMFPVLSADEMAGHYSENKISTAVRQGLLTGPDGAWARIARRVETVPDYRTAFEAMNGPGPVTFTQVSDAIAAFIAFEWRADASPFDLHLRGQDTMSAQAKIGMDLFYGKANCVSCHSGQFQTDHGYHSIAMPQIGPGKATRFESHARDTGRMRVTGRAEDAYRFRTPSLRNITRTAPYGHAGAYATLEAVIRHHLDPVSALRRYDPAQAVLPDLPEVNDTRVLNDPVETDAIAKSNALAPMPLSDAEVEALIAFLGALEDPVSLSGRLGVPDTVPSGLPVPQ